MSAGTARAASAPEVRYVALGDSYSAGVGATAVAGGSCGRTAAAYPALWMSVNQPTSYRSAACSGATTSSVLGTQLPVLEPTTTLVSITVGGNDVGFGPTMITCTVSSSTACAKAITAAQVKARTALPARLDAVYAAISARAPAAHVVVLSYPHLFSEALRCNNMSLDVRTRLNGAVDVIDEVTAAAALRHGFAFGDVRPAFAGHELCTDSNWLRGLVVPAFNSSYHPTADGQAGGYLPAFSAAIQA